MCMFLFTKIDSVIKNYINLYICVIVCTEEIWRLCMGYNDSLDKYMKKRQNEFRKDYLQLIMESRRLSKKNA